MKAEERFIYHQVDVPFTDDDVDRIVADYCQQPVIDTPIGQMVGRPTIEGSKIPYGLYTIGEIEIHGLSWGHGTLFLLGDKDSPHHCIKYTITHAQTYENDAVTDEDDTDVCEPVPIIETPVRAEKTITQANLERWGFSG